MTRGASRIEIKRGFRLSLGNFFSEGERFHNFYHVIWLLLWKKQILLKTEYFWYILKQVWGAIAEKNLINKYKFFKNVLAKRFPLFTGLDEVCPIKASVASVTWMICLGLETKRNAPLTTCSWLKIDLINATCWWNYPVITNEALYLEISPKGRYLIKRKRFAFPVYANER